jgi:putative OPT family oligopeptide transporter
MAVLRYLQGSSILENNIVQTQASAAGTLSAIIFALPGLLMLGYWQNFHFWQTLLIALAGGLLGVVFTIPLRHALVVKSDLPYPEGVAAAEILRAGHDESSNKTGLKDLVAGGLTAGVVSFLTGGFKLLSDSFGYFFTVGKAAFQVPLGFSLALLGAGYLIGIVAGVAILIGLFIAWGIAVPYLTSIAPMPADAALASFAQGVWKSQVRFIGAGTIAIAAVWTLITLIKPTVQGVKQSFSKLSATHLDDVVDTERNLSGKTILSVIVVSIVLLIATFSGFVGSAAIPVPSAWLLVALATLLTVLIGFLVAAASGYMAGLVGSSSSPISGIGIIAVVIASLGLLALGKSTGLLDTEGGSKFATALVLFVTSAIIAIAAISNDNLQDLKTGYLLGASPWKQQVALIIGVVVGSIVIAPVLDLLHQAYGFTGALPREGMNPEAALSAPQATLMSKIADGIFTGQIEWRYILTGVGLGVFLIAIDELLKRRGGVARLPVLAVGLGIYLPPAVDTPLVVGAVLAWWVQRQIKKRAAKNNTNADDALKTSERRGVLFASGLIVGESLIGVLLAIVILVSVGSGHSDAPLAIVGEHFGATAQWLGLAVFLGVTAWFAKRLISKR